MGCMSRDQTPFKAGADRERSVNAWTAISFWNSPEQAVMAIGASADDGSRFWAAAMISPGLELFP